MTQTWQIILTIIGLVVASITAIGVFYGPRLVAKRQEKREKLGVHFKDLKLNIIDSIGDLSWQIRNCEGQMTHQDDSPVPPIYKFEQVDLFTCFNLHFPLEADEWKQLKERSLEQNQSAKDFESKIKEYIESDHNLTPLKKDPIPDTGGEGKDPLRAMIDKAKAKANMEEMIVDVTPKCLCRTLYELAQNSSPVYDFTKAEIKLSDSLYILHFPKIVIGASQLVYAKTAEKVKYCNSVFVGIQESPDFRQEASRIYDNAKKLVKDFKDFSTRLAAKIDNISKYGIGREFKKLKKCPICKKI